MAKKRNSHNYGLFEGRRKIYIGYTSDIARVEEARKRSGEQSEEVRVLEGIIRRRQEQHLEAYSKERDGKVPRYNNNAR